MSDTELSDTAKNIISLVKSSYYGLYYAHVEDLVERIETCTSLEILVEGPSGFIARLTCSMVDGDTQDFFTLLRIEEGYEECRIRPCLPSVWLEWVARKKTEFSNRYRLP